MKRVIFLDTYLISVNLPYLLLWETTNLIPALYTEETYLFIYLFRKL